MEIDDELHEGPESGESGGVRDPGLDRHQWETEWEGLQEQLEDAPADTLPELAGLIERMLAARDFPIDDEVADEGVEPEILVEFRSAREIARRVDRGDDVDPGDVGEAIHNLRDIYERLIDRPEN